MSEPIFLQLTNINNLPVWVNMNWIWRITKSDSFGSVLYIQNTEVKQVVKETPEEIMKILENHKIEIMADLMKKKES